MHTSNFAIERGRILVHWDELSSPPRPSAAEQITARSAIIFLTAGGESAWRSHTISVESPADNNAQKEQEMNAAQEVLESATQLQLEVAVHRAPPGTI